MATAKKNVIPGLYGELILLYSVAAMTVREIEEDNTQLINDLYRLLKKYAAIRTLMGDLKSEYINAKNFPIIPRYSMLKSMIKDVMRDPNYMEVCHENT